MPSPLKQGEIMRKLFFALALLMVINSHGAWAVCAKDTDKFNTRGWCIDTNGVLTPQALETNGTATGYYGGRQATIIAVTTPAVPTTVTAAQSGSTFVDMGGVTQDTVTGAIGSKYVLPRAIFGLTYTFTTGAKETITIDTIDTSDKILYSPGNVSLQMGDSIKNPGQAGDTVTLTCATAGKWSISSQAGSSTAGGSTLDTLWLANGIN